MQTICDYIAQGITLKKACKMAGPLAPNPKTVWKWRNENPDIDAMYQAALDTVARLRQEAREREQGKMVQRIVAAATTPIPARPAAHWASALFME